jgi:hypothetical protein
MEALLGRSPEAPPVLLGISERRRFTMAKGMKHQLKDDMRLVWLAGALLAAYFALNYLACYLH